MRGTLPFIISQLGSKSLRFKDAKNYDEFAIAQNHAAKGLVGLLETISCDFAVIYEIGCGSGLLTKIICERLRFAKLILNDLYKSDIMDEFNAQIGDITELDMPNNLDLVISSSTFQWISQLSALASKIYASLNYGGMCAFSMLTSGSLAELSSFTGQSLDYKNCEQIAEIFGRNFRIIATSKHNFIQDLDSLRDLLFSLKQTGVNNLKGDFVLNKSSLAAMDAHFGGDYKLSYNFFSVVAIKDE